MGAVIVSRSVDAEGSSWMFGAVSLRSIGFVGCRPKHDAKLHSRPFCDSHREAYAHAKALVEERWSHREPLPSRRAAFRELLGSGHYESSTSSALASFTRVDDVSLPPSLLGAPMLEDVVPSDSALYLVEFERMLRPDSELCAPEDFPKAYWDPVLAKRRRKKIELLSDLVKLGLCRVAPVGTARDEVAFFIVETIGKAKRRLIVDARRSNLRFASPHGAALCSSEAMGRIEIELPCGIAPKSRAARDVVRRLELS